MEYEICNRCRLNAMCIYRTQDCKRWNTIYQSLKENIKIMIDGAHARYDKREVYDRDLDVHSSR